MPQNAETIARALFENYFKHWNKSDNAGLRTVANFPFVAMRPGGGVQVSATPPDFMMDFVQMNHTEGWHSSSLDKVEVVNAEAPDKIMVLVNYSRYKADGKKYMLGRTFYLLTNVHDHWGIQIRWVMSQKNV